MKNKTSDVEARVEKKGGLAVCAQTTVAHSLRFEYLHAKVHSILLYNVGRL